MSKQFLTPLSLLVIFLSGTVALAQSPAQAPEASPPSRPPAIHKSGSTNITAILENAHHFTTFIRILQSTQIDNVINDRLNDSSHGLTIFAPNDNAFGNLRAGTLNSYDNNRKIELIRFHMISSFLPIPSGFQTASNPISTEAGSTAKYPLNVTTTGNTVDQVLFPLYFFQSHSPAPAPAPALVLAPAPAKPAKKSAPISPSSLGSTAGSTDTDTPSVQSSSSVLSAIPFAGFLAAALFWSI
ncbi:hypothetical protein NMG60_11000536 [Bertholletia excelsa]